MEQYTVTGMSCAACSARVEKAVLSLDNVNSCSVSLLTNSMLVDGAAAPEEIINAVKGAGYNAFKKDTPSSDSSTDATTDELKALKQRLLSSLIFLIILMYFSMGYTMWGLPLPSFFDGNPIAVALTQMLLAIIVMVINKKFFISGFKAIINKAPNMDTLVALGSGASFLYSTYALYAMTAAQVENNSAAVMQYMHEFYFESAAMILALITVGKMLEARSKGKTTTALKSLMNLAPKTATIISGGTELEVPIESIKKGDVFLVKPGSSIPADGIVIEGSCAVNESALTGESIPVDKTVGDTVLSATINQSGFIKVEASRVGEDTSLSQIIKMVSDSAASKAPIAKVADKVSGVFVPAVITIAFITTIVWLLFGKSIGFALARGISVLVISCPCALGLATPVAIMVGNGIGAKNGILFKNSEALEETGRIQIAALDKTGTITMGIPEVTDIIPLNGTSENELLTLAYSLEIKSEHPLAGAIIKKTFSRNIQALESTDFTALPGNGLTAVVGTSSLAGGNLNFISEKCEISVEIKQLYNQLADQGKTPLFFSRDNTLIGIIAVADIVKPDSAEAVAQLKHMGIRVVMLTGDNAKTAAAVKKLTNVDEVISDVLPSGKEQAIRELKKHGKVAMVGDGINDAPALTCADIGIAIGTGTDVAIDAADVVLMHSTLKDVSAAIRLSRKTLKNIHENLFWAFIYNCIGIPLAAGVFIPLFNLKLNPMFGAAAMSLSSFCVVTNALRLNLFDIKNAAKDKKIKQKQFKEEKNMTKTLKIEGMMCPHCETRVKTTLEAIDGVASVVASHNEDTAVLTLTKEVSDEILIKAVNEQGYKVVG